MECKDYRELFAAKLCGDISREQNYMIEDHLESCSECRKEFESVHGLWTLMGGLPQEDPSENMTERFNEAVSRYKKEKIAYRNPIRALADSIAGVFTMPVFSKLALGIVLLAAGMGAGFWLRPSGKPSISYNRQIDSLSVQVSELKQMMMLSLLREQSASMRLQAVSYTGELNTVDKKIIDALLLTLNKDPNVNVRLATLEALVNLADDPSVREGLVRSIENQVSPIVQAAIADVMVRLNEKNSVEHLKKLLGRKDLNQSVRTNIEQSIQKLI